MGAPGWTPMETEGERPFAAVGAGVAIVTDSGRATGGANRALDERQWQAACARSHAAWLRFHDYTPTVSLGVHQSLGLAARAAFCHARGIEIVRRATGGGALYLDGGELAWTLTFVERSSASMPFAKRLARLCAAVAAGLRHLGVAQAEYAAPNEIEVRGRCLGAGFLLARDGVFLFQGAIALEEADIETALKALRLPNEKLTPEGILSARERRTSLRALGLRVGREALRAALARGFGEALGLDFAWRPWPAAAPGPMSRYLQTAAEGVVPAPPDDWDALAADWQQAFVKTAGGAVLHVALRLGPDGETLEELIFSGDIQCAPPQALANLATRLRGERCERVAAAVEEAWCGVEAVGELAPRDIARLLALAVARRGEQAHFGLSCRQANTLMVHDPGEEGLTAAEILTRAGAVLVPYCAKPTWCKWRHREGCPECGRCEVGEAYRLARARGLRVLTILNFEHLERTLAELRAQGVAAYVGMCCRHFYLKRHVAFRAAGLPALLMDIGGANCYELQQEDLAYAGRFAAQARLDEVVLRRVFGARARAGGDGGGESGEQGRERGPAEHVL
jgi:lipoate-protein ligase A